MPDFDVQALSLASPPSAAPVTTYRPAVRVRNNGIHPADITGNLRIYRREPPGELLETHQLSLLNLGAGLEGDALSSGYWTPTTADIAREFLFTAHVDTDHDQNMGNNDLSPITVIVTAGEPPPPPGVLAHATQHEAGGADQVEITGLHGLTADAQTALAHKATHQAGGADAINVDGLLGTLAQGQPIADHHESHEDGGGDELYVGGLRGQLADNQPALTHDNARHDPNYSIDPHGATDHNSTVEATANKNQANGYAGLGANGYVPAAKLGLNSTNSRILTSDQAYRYPREAFPNALRVSDAVYGDPIEINRNSTVTILDTTLPAALLTIRSAIHVRGLIFHRGQPTAMPTLYLDLKENDYAWAMAAATLLLNKVPPAFPAYDLIRFDLWIFFWDDGGYWRLQPWLEALTSAEHGNTHRDWATVAERTFDFANSLQIRLRFAEPDVDDAYGQCGPIELSIAGAPVL